MTSGKSVTQVAAHCLSILAFVCTSASATILNPDSGTYGSDNGASTFIPGDVISSIKVADILTGSGYSTAFGFYRPGSPGEFAILFDSADGIGDLAFASFLTGQTFDADTGELAAFTPWSGPIAFFFFILPDGGSPFAVYSEPALNGGADYFAAFPNLTTPESMLLGFEATFPGAGLLTVSFAIVSPLTPVPEPGSVALTLACLLSAGLALQHSRRRRL